MAPALVLPTDVADPAQVDAATRNRAKVINFGLLYGMGPQRVAQETDLSLEESRTFIERYFARYPGVAAYMQRTRALAREQGYVETVFGRRLFLPDIRAGSGPRRAGAERAAINAPMQGTAADLVKLAMIAVQQHLDRERLSTRLILQVHDELVLEVAVSGVERVRKKLVEIMCGAAELAVALKVDTGTGPNWDDAH